MAPAAFIPRPQRKLEQILSPHHPLCKEDVIWMLEYMKKKVAEEDPHLLGLSQPRLLQNFRCFAEIALQLIHHRPVCDHEMDGIRKWLQEASFGLGEEQS